MPQTKISFTAKKDKGTQFAGLKVQKYSPPGQAAEPLQNIKLVNGKGSKMLDIASSYTLYYGFFGEPDGTLQILVADDAGTQLLDQTDTIPDDKLSESGKYTFVVP